MKDSQKKLTDKHYWDSIYKEQKPLTNYKLIDYDQLLNFNFKKILNNIKHFYSGGEILEIGAGSSDWLLSLANELDHSGCTGLDYSKKGCELLLSKSQNVSIDIEVVHADMFNPPKQMFNKFDFTFSMGVLEHFSNLTEVLVSCSKFSKTNGLHFAVIPNMSGLIGLLTKWLNKDIYDLHIPHDLNSFKRGHQNAGLEIIYSNYFCSHNFGILSSAKPKKSYFKFKYLTYVFFIILSLSMNVFEKYIFNLPSSKFFSPYIIIISKKIN
tara:strand:- start:100 stop:903 length:804 start_codon:yes stop_codon:yes gene_type:complete